MFREPERKGNGKEDAEEISSEGGATPISLEPETSDTPITLEDTVSLYTFK